MDTPPANWPASEPDLATAGAGWAAHVGAHPLWQRAGEDPDLAVVRDRTVAFVAALAHTRDDNRFLVADDPWQDPHLGDR